MRGVGSGVAGLPSACREGARREKVVMAWDPGGVLACGGAWLVRAALVGGGFPGALRAWVPCSAWRRGRSGLGRGGREFGRGGAGREVEEAGLGPGGSGGVPVGVDSRGKVPGRDGGKSVWGGFSAACGRSRGWERVGRWRGERHGKRRRRGNE